MPPRTGWNMPWKFSSVLKFSPLKSLKSALNTCKCGGDSQYPYLYPYFSTTVIDYIPETRVDNVHFLHSDPKHPHFLICFLLLTHIL